MTDEQPNRTMGLSPAQVAGSALAAVTAAVFASFAGTAGTIIGAALGSVVATIGAAAYTAWLSRTSEAVRRRATQVRQTALLTGATPRRITDGPLRPGGRTSPPGDTGDADPADRGAGGFSLGLLPWRKIALSTVAVLVTTFGGITAMEAITGQPISALLGQNSSTGTTLGHVSGGDSNKPAPSRDGSTRTPEPSPSSRPTSTTSPDSGATPSQRPTPAAPASKAPIPAPTPTTTPTPSSVGSAAPVNPGGTGN